MKILITSNRFFPDIGGIETISAILARFFVDAGHSVRLITQTLGEPSIDIRTFPFPVLRQPTPSSLLDCYRWSDVVLQNNIEIRQLWPQLLFRRPTIIILQTWLRSVYGRRRLVDRFKKLILYSAQHVVSVSDSIRQDSFLDSLVIGNPYDSNLFKRLPNVTKEKSIVFLGRLVSDKGVDLLLKSFSDLGQNEWHLSLIGSGPERASLELLSEKLGIASQVHFLGSLQGELLVRELNRHELMVVPSLWREPFGVVALEGLACGCVVLASDGGGLVDAVGSAGLLFSRGIQSDLTSKLSLLIHDCDLRHNLRSNAPPHLAHFDEHVICSFYLNLLNGILNSRPCLQS